MVGISEAPRFSNGWTHFGLILDNRVVLRPPGFGMVGLLEAFRLSYGCTLRGLSVFVWLDSQRTPVIRMVALLEAPRYSYGWTLRGSPVFVWIDYWRSPVFV